MQHTFLRKKITKAKISHQQCNSTGCTFFFLYIKGHYSPVVHTLLLGKRGPCLCDSSRVAVGLAMTWPALISIVVDWAHCTGLTMFSTASPAGHYWRQSRCKLTIKSTEHFKAKSLLSFWSLVPVGKSLDFSDKRSFDKASSLTPVTGCGFLNHFRLAVGVLSLSNCSFVPSQVEFIWSFKILNWQINILH